MSPTPPASFGCPRGSQEKKLLTPLAGLCPNSVPALHHKRASPGGPTDSFRQLWAIRVKMTRSRLSRRADCRAEWRGTARNTLGNKLAYDRFMRCRDLASCE